MRRGQNHKAEAWAVLRVHNVLVEELKWHSGNNPLPDFGVDVLTEIVAADDVVTGGLIGIQVKGGKSWFKPKCDQGWVFSSDDDHLAYWLGNSLPVIVVLVNEERQAFWQAITPDTVTEKEGRFSVVVPRAQRFDGSALEPLLALARPARRAAGDPARALRGPAGGRGAPAAAGRRHRSPGCGPACRAAGERAGSSGPGGHVAGRGAADLDHAQPGGAGPVARGGRLR